MSENDQQLHARRGVKTVPRIVLCLVLTVYKRPGFIRRLLDSVDTAQDVDLL